WKDSLIYLTHAVPNEPTFSAAAIVGRVSPAPVAAIHSTHDEFVSLEEVQRVLDAAKEPKNLWIVNASDHRFSDNLPEFDQRLLEAVAWVRANAAQRGHGVFCATAAPDPSRHWLGTVSVQLPRKGFPRVLRRGVYGALSHRHHRARHGD